MTYRLQVILSITADPKTHVFRASKAATTKQAKEKKRRRKKRRRKRRKRRGRGRTGTGTGSVQWARKRCFLRAFLRHVR
jgi:hypothetical protein